jgi:hypothetical protein
MRTLLGYTLLSERPPPHGKNYASITKLCREKTASSTLFLSIVTAIGNARVRNAKLVFDLAGGSPADGTYPVAIVAITGSGKSDRRAGSPVVKVSVG